MTTVTVVGRTALLVLVAANGVVIAVIAVVGGLLPARCPLVTGVPRHE